MSFFRLETEADRPGYVRARLWVMTSPAVNSTGDDWEVLAETEIGMGQRSAEAIVQEARDWARRRGPELVARRERREACRFTEEFEL